MQVESEESREFGIKGYRNSKPEEIDDGRDGVGVLEIRGSGRDALPVTD